MNAKTAMSQPEDKQLFSQDYQRQLSEKHQSDDQWGNTGIAHYKTLLTLIDHFKVNSVLDYGCGKGMIGKRFREEQTQPGNKYKDVVFHEYDPGIEGKRDDRSRADLVICTDVMEHIEPSFLDNVLSDMAHRTLRAIFMVISCVPAVHRLPDGRNAHLIIEHPTWWVDKLNEYFVVSQAENKSGELYVLAVAKPSGDTKKKLTETDKTVKRAQLSFDEGQYTRTRLTLLADDNTPQSADALFLLGKTAYATDDLMSAATHLYAAFKLQKTPESQRLLGISLSKLGRYADALRFLDDDAILKAYGDDDDYIGALMLCWNNTLQPKKSIALFQSRENNGHLAVDGYVQALILQQDYEGSVAAAEKAVQDYPEDDILWAVLEKAYDTSRRFDDAERAAQKCISLKPDHAAYYSNFGLTLLHQNKLDDAVKAFDQAIAHDRLLNASYINLANVYRLKKDWAKEEQTTRIALELDPVSADANYGLGINLLRHEQYEEAFAYLEWYWHKNMLSSTRLPTSYRRWYGEDLSGKTIMVYADQGVGDTVMMARYNASLLRDQKPAKLLFNVDKKLRGMFEHQYQSWLDAGQVDILDESVRLPGKGIDFVVATTSLPHVMGTRIDNVPLPEGYITRRDTIDYKEGNPKTFVIGISWYTKSMDAGFRRSLNLMDFAFLAGYDHVRIIDLQYGDTSAERAAAKEKGFDVYHDDKIDAWADMQAFTDQVAACDLIVSIDNTTVHTAGALGVPCWVILPSEPFWRWPIAGESTPWYDSLRLFRPDENEEYRTVMKSIQSELERLFKGDQSVLAGEKFTPLFPVKPKARTALVINDTETCFTWGHYAALKGLKSGLEDKGYLVQSVHTLELPWFSEHLPDIKDFDDPAFLSRCRYRDPTLFYHLEHSDVVVINGEGMMNGLGDAALQMMYLAYVAKNTFGKKVSIINHSCFPEGGTNLSDAKRLAYYLKVYKLLDSCCVRESASHDLLNSIQVPASLGFDTSVLWLEDYLQAHQTEKAGKDIILTAGPGYDSRSAETMARFCKKLSQSGFKPIVLNGACWHTAQEDRIFAADMQELAGRDVVTVMAGSPEEYMEVFCQARAVVGGHYQGIVMAHALGIPVIPVAGGGSYTSLLGLSKTHGLPAPAAYRQEDLLKRLEAHLKTLKDQEVTDKREKRQRLEKLCALARKNFESL